ncbi:hypothetical protein ACFUJR_27935 [Streptomyces sp. NPDC057271]|uniref:hypothetical protein n=1 Tax=unclassified Streptomyces TaxID=2593676 RepID=UPI00362500ED
MTSDEGLIRLGQLVEGRIKELGLQYTDVTKRAGFSDETLSKIRKGVRVGRVTYRRLEIAIGWGADSCDAVRGGGEPVLVDPAAPPVPSASASTMVEGSVDPQAAAILTILEGLPERVQREVLRRLGERIPPSAHS